MRAIAWGGGPGGLFKWGSHILFPAASVGSRVFRPISDRDKEPCPLQVKNDKSLEYTAVQR